MAGAADVSDTPGITLHEDAVDAARRASGGLAVGAGHTDQEEGCAEDFCGVQNPAGETDRGSFATDEDSDNGPGYRFGKFNKIVDSPPGTSTYSSTHESSYATGSGNAGSGYIAI